MKSRKIVVLSLSVDNVFASSVSNGVNLSNIPFLRLNYINDLSEQLHTFVQIFI